MRESEKVLVDCGANIGRGLKVLLERFNCKQVYAFEPNPALIPILDTISPLDGTSVETICKAVWCRDEVRPFYLGHHESSTLLDGKVVPSIYNRQIDYEAPIFVDCVDFSRWLGSLNLGPKSAIVKMDIEGAEYPVLEHLISQGTIGLISKLLVEWHYDRFPDFPDERHQRLVSTLSQHVQIEEWD